MDQAVVATPLLGAVLQHPEKPEFVQLLLDQVVGMDTAEQFLLPDRPDPRDAAARGYPQRFGQRAVTDQTPIGLQIA